MPRKARKHVKAPFYHIMCQGIKKENIFISETDSKKYLFLLNKYKQDFFIDILAYCIMPNHVHLLIHSYDTNLISKFMHKVNLIFAINYNETYKRVGYVFRDRFRMEEITDINYLNACITYIHNNPVKANICTQPSDYKYSSYNEFNGKPITINLNVLKNILDTNITNNASNYIFLDIENNQEETAKEIIRNFEKEKNKDITSVLKNYNDKKELLIELHINHKISYRCIEKILNIKRRKIPTYLHDQKGHFSNNNSPQFASEASLKAIENVTKKNRP